MKAPHIVTGIDIGSNTVRVIIAQQDPASDTIKILGVGTAPMRGMQKGVITDVEEGVAALGSALDIAERISGIPVEKAYVSINGSHLTSQNLRGVIAVSRADGEITPDDVDRVINAAQAVSIPPNREILHVLPQNYIVDGQEHIQDPVGMTGVRLEVEAHVIEGSVPFIKNLTKVINQSGVHIEDFVFSPLAASLAVLDKRQKELGVVLVDIGAGTTSMVVYEENVLLHTGVLPVGASHITNDIAIGLRTSIDIAEAIKVSHGTAIPSDVPQNEMISIEGEEGEQESISRREVANIISARLEELFSFVDRELKNIGRSGLLPAGVIVTGGGAHMDGLIELAKKRLRLPVRIGVPALLSGISDQTQEPEFAVAIGLVQFAVEQESRPGAKNPLKLPDVGRAFSKLRSWSKNFLP
ncbi:MAG: cell division protein FtsA [Candidatus Andersenbacteria bacterium RIFCSPHIGHO2_02_FULL_45_11]|uniref:Cell division protein FtsA n=1 Tax=Candidatus Andersenbacteria bacterium RIFCSPHIGHO2_12_FULL_45_11 TaxID=1797281 RepID=A0A1G1X4A8_9BACT|nr:MAG: cell division protein FtsA [Candidatus Andersenbacteria bacterium RIFCSPHIGHO2_01_FULL_46_36]OGY32671.1 MAG: cell division protein FtsA [Candidatus Andersenbacteria bacterium RIFCSPHIGHO2_02_FULL_45_11]OGY34410.1 MAG: cell division protein FtsA [Candidatus Andersenbacteria bacterium RIFCSPHIGHO2_12_FULL_45_11]